MGTSNTAGGVAAPVLQVQYDLSNSSCWPGSGTTITDLSGKGNNATLISSPTLGSTYITTKGGSSPSYISTTYNLASTWTVHIVATISSTQTYWCTLWGNDNWLSSTAYGFIYYLGSSGAGSLGGGGGNGAVTTTQTMGTKMLMSFTYDGTYFKYYTNGSLATTSSSFTNPKPATVNTYFGARHTNNGTGATDGMNATYYRMELWSGAQSSTTISTFYNSIKSTYGI